MIIHVVQPGDSLYRIAQQHGVTLPYLIAQNSFQQPGRLTPGQTVVVPRPSGTYTVRRGDTLGSIAAALGTSVMALWQNNPQLMGTDRIAPGQVLTASYQQQKLGKMQVNGYAYPSIDYRILRRTLPYLTYLSIFSYGFDAQGNILPLPNTENMLRMARLYDVRPLLVLTTIDESGRFSGERAHALLSSAPARGNLIRSLKETLPAQGFYGVDVDFEYVPEEDAALYASFIREVAHSLAENGLITLVSLAPKTSAAQKGLLYEAHDYRALGAAADLALLMTYEWGYRQSEPMAVAPIDKVEQVVAYATSVIPSARLLMGMPNYGYIWRLPYEKGKTEAQSFGNVQAVDQAIRSGAAIQYDDTAQTPYYRFWRDRAQYETWFEDARSVRAKLALASEYRLRGVSIWNIMRYFPQLYLVLNCLYEIEKIK